LLTVKKFCYQRIETECIEKNIKGAHGKIFTRGQWKNQDREIEPISTLFFISGGLGGAMAIRPGQGSPQGSAASRARVKSEDFFWKNSHFRKNAYLFRKCRVIIVRKK